MPVAMGMVNENAADDNALNITRAEANINIKASSTCIFSRKFSQSLILINKYPLSLSLINAAPVTLKMAYNEQYKIVLIIICLIQ
jgi:hypothetical protein